MIIQHYHKHISHSYVLLIALSVITFKYMLYIKSTQHDRLHISQVHIHNCPNLLPAQRTYSPGQWSCSGDSVPTLNTQAHVSTWQDKHRFFYCLDKQHTSAFLALFLSPFQCLLLISSACLGWWTS